MSEILELKRDGRKKEISLYKDLVISSLGDNELAQLKEKCSALARRFFDFPRKARHHLSISITNNDIYGQHDHQKITFNEKLLIPTKEGEFEHVLFHEYSHWLDYNLKIAENGTELSLLDEEAAAEMYYYLVIGFGDEAEAENCARQDYKEKRVQWLQRYYVPQGPDLAGKSFNEIYKKKVNWSEAKKRAVYLYKRPETKDLCKYLGYQYPDDKEIS